VFVKYLEDKSQDQLKQSLRVESIAFWGENVEPTKEDKKLFEKHFQFSMKKNNYYFKKKNAFALALLAFKDKIQVGKMTIYTDGNQESTKTAYFGFFDCIDDPAVAQALFAGAAPYLRELGCQKIVGPVNFNVHYGYRIQTKGQHRPAFHGEPRNPSFYGPLLDSLGFKILQSYRSWELTPKDFIYYAQEMGSALNRYPQFEQNYVIKNLSIFDFIRIDKAYNISQVFMKGFEKNLAFTPIDFLSSLKIFGRELLDLCPLTSAIAYEKITNKIIGVSLRFKDRKDDSNLLLKYTAILPEHRKKGVAYALYYHTFKALSHSHYTRAIAALVHPGPCIYERLGEPDRTYCLFESSLDQWWISHYSVRAPLRREAAATSRAVGSGR
jgi:hypothetical protein